MAKYIRQFNHYNQRLLNAAMANHNHCMNSCLGYHDGDPKARTKYEAHDCVRYLYMIECCRSAIEEQAVRDAQHMARYPMIEQLRRERALRSK